MENSKETYISANRAVEYLEAEQEKFILGVTPLYRCFLTNDPKKRTRKALLAIENFIIQVNGIHLSQLQQNGESQPQEEEEFEPEQAETAQPTSSPVMTEIPN